VTQYHVIGITEEKIRLWKGENKKKILPYTENDSDFSSIKGTSRTKLEKCKNKQKAPLYISLNYLQF
jgi:hypothetical protein